MTGKKRSVEALWKDFLTNTSQWWDHRTDKINGRFPDFKHKQTGEALWLANARNPAWVQAELVNIPPGTLQSHPFAWTQRLQGYVKAKQYMKTMEVFHQMQQERICPDGRTFLPVLNACAGLGALEEGKHVHAQIIQAGYESDVYMANCLVNMYVKCGSIGDAWNLFDKMLEHDVVSWGTIIGGYVKYGQALKAMELYQKMLQEGVEPNAFTFVGVLNACAGVAALEEGRRIHEQILQRGCESNVYVANCLVDMYAKCGSVADALSVFNNMREHDVVSWNAMIGGYVKSGQGQKGIELFRKMQLDGVKPDTITFIAVLNACASVAALEEGRRVHDQITDMGCESSVYVATCLVDMYAKCGSIGDAWRVFDKMRKRSVVSWNTMIRGYVKTGEGLKAIKLFRKMSLEGVEPDAVTFVGALNACASVAALDQGQWGSDANYLVEMYAKPEDPWSAFDKTQEQNVVPSGAVIGVHVESVQELRAPELFQEMQKERVEPNSITRLGKLKAWALEEGRRAHKQIIQQGCQSHVYVANCLVDMYAKCGSAEDAWSVFNQMREPDVVSWNAMIGGYVNSGQGLKAMELFRKMKLERVKPNTVTFVGVLNACASVAALEEGRSVHRQIIQRGCDSDVHVATSLADMYAKCGCIEDAWHIFNKMQSHDVVSWNVMIGGYAMHGYVKKAIELYKQIGAEGVEINGITFTGLLSACSHGGLVKEGLRYFKAMNSCFKLVPTTEHYSCMINILGRAGLLEEAEHIIQRMPVACLWMSLLGACRIHGNVKMAERAAKQCWQLDPENASGHVLLSNIYAAARNLDSSAAAEEQRMEAKVWKDPGRTWIEVNSVVYPFVENDMQHPQILEIYAELERLLVQLNNAGYVPVTRFMLHEDKKTFVLSQSEAVP